MISKRPYMLRAWYDWIVDSGMTPHLVVNAEHAQVVVPQQYVQEGKIVLNASPSAVQGLFMDTEQISFSARFGGSPFQVFLPVASVDGVYARENGEGVILAGIDGNDVFEQDAEGTSSSTDRPVLSSVETSDQTSEDNASLDSKDAENKEKPQKKKPTLTVVK
jgi:stringent starvation protein B